jgi:hypothetical protein
LNRTFIKELEKLSSGFYPDELESVLEETRLWKIKPDISSAEKLLQGRIMMLVRDLEKRPRDENIPAEIVKFLDLGENLEITLHLGDAQILFLKILRTLEADSSEPLPSLFSELADRLSVRLNCGR